jgi:membrane fusion protein, heavy metal efflux system
MKKYVLFPFIPLLLAACGGYDHGTGDAHGHDHTMVGGHDHGEIEPLAFTRYTDSTELFVEFKPMAVGEEVRFAAHFTRLGALETPVLVGTASVSFIGSLAGEVSSADAPSSPGIFRLAITPHKTGVGTLRFTVTTNGFTDTLTIDSVRVYADAHDAAHAPPQEGPAGDITYLKEQAWKIPFAGEMIRSMPFAPLLHVGAEVEPVPSGEEVITARSAGVVHLMGDAPLEGMAVSAGNALFTLSTSGVSEGNAALALAQARHALDRAKADLERSEALYKDKLATQDELLRARNAFADADAQVKQLGGALTISSGINGHVRTLHVREGQFVQAGAVLATVARNDRLSIHADAPAQAFNKLGEVTDARIKAQDGRVHTLKELNGRVVSVGRAAAGPYVPVRLEVDGSPTLVAGSVAEVWLIGNASGEAVTVPLSAILEQEGRFFCYVHTAGETMEKRWVSLGANDGLRAQVISGLSPGERVITTGAMDIKLASAGGAIPAHGHEH